MKRGDLLKSAAAFGFVATMPSPDFDELWGGSDQLAKPTAEDGSKPLSAANSLKPPAEGNMPVAFLLSEGAVVIDFCGPWEVFENVMVPGRADHPFKLYTLAETTKPIHASGGM